MASPEEMIKEAVAWMGVVGVQNLQPSTMLDMTRLATEVRLHMQYSREPLTEDTANWLSQLASAFDSCAGIGLLFQGDLQRRMDPGQMFRSTEGMDFGSNSEG